MAAEGWKRNYRYGTLICDLERRRTIALLPDREPATAQAWLSGQPQIEIVTRPPWWRLCPGSSACSARGCAGGRPLAPEGERQPSLAATRACMRQVRAAVGVATVDPRLLTAAEKLRYKGYLRREDVNAASGSHAGPGSTSCLRRPNPHPPQAGGSFGRLADQGCRQPSEVVRARAGTRSPRGSCCDLLCLVQCSGRRSNQQAECGQAPDVWPR